MVTASEIVYDVLVSIMFIVVAGLLLFPSNLYLPLDRRIACIWGASICAIVAYCFRDSVNPLSFVDVDVLLVLSAIMAINFLLLRHPWTTWIIERMQWYIRNDVDKAFYIVSALSFFISQVIMNDGLCLMIVHPVLDAFRKKRRNSINNIVDPKYNPAHHVHDPFYFMLNIACSSNIGSVMTFAGNPQNLIIAQYLGNYMNCAVYYLYMILPALVTWLFTLGLINYYRKQAVKKLQQSGDSLNLVEMTDLNNSIRDGEADEERGKEEDRKSEEKKEDSETDASTSPFHRKPEKTNSKRSVNAETLSDQLSPNSKKRALSELEVYNSVIKDDDDADVDIVVPRKGGISIANRLSKLNVEGKHLIFPAMLLPLIILEFVGVIPLTGLFITMSISMVAVVILFDYYLADHSAVTKSHEKIHEITVYIEDLFHSLDYNLLVIFTGLFIVSGSFLETGIPSFFWRIMAGHTAFKTNLSIFVISIYIIVFSQLVGNVPLVYLAKVEVEELDRQPQIFGWLILAYVSTIAGNFTLVGSAANIIVVEKAMRHKDCPVKINAKEHFRVCGVITLVSIAFGVLILSLEMALVGQDVLRSEKQRGGEREKGVTA